MNDIIVSSIRHQTAPDVVYTRCVGATKVEAQWSDRKQCWVVLMGGAVAKPEAIYSTEVYRRAYRYVDSLARWLLSDSVRYQSQRKFHKPSHNKV